MSDGIFDYTSGSFYNFNTTNVGSIAEVNISGGSFNHSGGAFTNGQNADSPSYSTIGLINISGTGTYNMSGSAQIKIADQSKGEIRVGSGGTFSQTGGTVYSGWIRTAYVNVNSGGTLNLAGGTFNNGAPFIPISGPYTSYFTVNGGTVNISSGNFYNGGFGSVTPKI